MNDVPNFNNFGAAKWPGINKNPRARGSGGGLIRRAPQTFLMFVASFRFLFHLQSLPLVFRYISVSCSEVVLLPGNMACSNGCLAAAIRINLLKMSFQMTLLDCSLSVTCKTGLCN